MLIKSIELKNFKQLKETKIFLSDRQSIFVGANNSGKTSAIQAISKFLSTDTKFSIYDFTLSNWSRLNGIFESLMKETQSENVEEESETIISKLKTEAAELFPSMKLTLKVEESELYHVQKLIPTLDANVSKVSVYFRFEPESYDELFNKYIMHRESVENLNSQEGNAIDKETVINQLWPKDFRHFLTNIDMLRSLFKVKAYQANANEDEKEYCFDESTRIEGNPLNGIVRIDVINAQRGLTDNGKKTDGKNSIGEQSSSIESLSQQFTKYYNKFIDPNKLPKEKDIEMLTANYNATESFKSQLEVSLKDIIKDLYKLGYPGFGSPSVQIAPKVNMINTIENDSSILFNTHLNDEDNSDFYLPEHHNGLGFQNLISIFFKLTYFKEARRKKGRLDLVYREEKVAPLHLILIEEPEAHLHAQAQKVFIDKAFEILDEGGNLKTQLVISTHSSHITHNTYFNDLLYFKRIMIDGSEALQTDVVNLNTVFDKDEKKNEKFVEQYLKIYDHDLFFADGVILIEGVGERILLPKFIRENHPHLQSKYVTMLEIGGSHAHRLFPLLKKLERPTLIITDIDSVNKKGKKAAVRKSENYNTANSTINNWKMFDENSNDITIKYLLERTETDKVDDFLRLAYQYENHAMGRRTAFARTFEDSIAMTNVEFFSVIDTFGLSKKFRKSINENKGTVNFRLSEKLFNDIDGGAGKSNFALDLLFYEYQKDGGRAHNSALKIPQYIEEGLEWLDRMLSASNRSIEGMTKKNGWN